MRYTELNRMRARGNERGRKGVKETEIENEAKGSETEKKSVQKI